jgi:hypothetical protein
MALRSLLTALTLALATTLGCASPTLPLPPPTAPSILTGTEPGTYRLTSIQGAEPNALVIVINRNPELSRTDRVSGTIADEQGSWELEVIATPGDVLDISQESGSIRSPSTTIQVR